MIWLENLCRLCGIVSSNSNVHSVFGFVGIEDKIRKCLNISILKEDCKPKGICGQCLVKIEQFSDFVDICIDANQRFDSFILSRTSWPAIKNLNVPEYMQQKSVIVNLKNGIENYSNVSDSVLPLLPLENVNATLNEEVLQIVDNSNIYTTNLQKSLNDYMITTSKNIPYYPEYNNTVLRHSSDVENLAIQSNLGSNHDLSYEFPDRVTKPIEGKNFTQYFTTQNQLNLEECFEETINVEDLNSRKVRTKIDSIPKQNATENLITVDSVRNTLNLSNAINVGKIKSQKKYKCPHCERVYIRRLSLNSHIAIHTQNRPFTCSKCGKAFPIKSELTIHTKIHSEQYQCKICFKSFVVPSKLERHIRTHTNEKPFECDFRNCGKSFSDPSNLSEHKETHEEGRTLKCECCEKCFKTKNQLKSHKLSHKTKALYTCDICKKSYKYKTNLIFHMKKHTGYTCPYCDLNCEKLSALVKHRKECNRRKEKYFCFF